MKNNKKTKLKIGDKVECINAVPGLGTLAGYYTFPKGYLRHGKIYTVTQILNHWFWSIDENKSKNHPCVMLKEVPSFNKFGMVIPFQRFRFKKI